jgi:hypothetical protein
MKNTPSLAALLTFLGLHQVVFESHSTDAQSDFIPD